MANSPFTVAQMRPIRDGMTISRPAGLGSAVPVTWFSLGAGTSITPESYDTPTIYLGGEGVGVFLLGETAQRVPLAPGKLLFVPSKCLCGVEAAKGTVYTELILKRSLL